jgi:hypothetical protein
MTRLLETWDVSFLGVHKYTIQQDGTGRGSKQLNAYCDQSCCYAVRNFCSYTVGAL